MNTLGPRHGTCRRLRLLGLSAAVTLAVVALAEPVTLTVLDDATGSVVPCRVHLRDPAGRPVNPGRLPFWHDHFVCDGTARLELKPGDYAAEVERGPEWQAVPQITAIAFDRERFLDWTRERMSSLKVDEPRRREEALEPLRQAEKFWQDKVSQANRTSP